jgi:glycosyltransferase involved in cell wall biosynthesis
MVQILLSTYNGAEFLKPLMASLLAQEHPEVEILVRDDGSQDRSVEILRDCARAHPRVRVIGGANLGFFHSFWTLLQAASPAADYYAFCDQDDVWRPDKVSRAVAALRRYPSDTPLLYCTRLAIVDRNLKLLGYSPLPRKGLSFRNALVECAVWGCTVLFNHAARHLLLRGWPQQAYSHDWWSYLVLAAFGQIHYEAEPSLLYRQHPSNVFGAPVGPFHAFRTSVVRFVRQGKFRPVLSQAEEFQRIYGCTLPPSHRAVLERLLESRGRFADRLRYARTCDVYRHSPRDHGILKLLLALNRL